MAGGVPAAKIMDNTPSANVPPFGMCVSIASPMISAVTAAALVVRAHHLPVGNTESGGWEPWLAE
jgi:hypothetical protein